MIVYDRSRAIGLAVIGIMAVSAGVFLASDGVQLFGAGTVLVGGGTLASSFRHVRASRDGVRLDYVWRRISIPWSQVVAFDMRAVRLWYGERVNRPVVILADGSYRSIPGAQQVALLPNPHIRLRVLDRLESLRREYQGRW